jgi:hypothetical protein
VRDRIPSCLFALVVTVVATAGACRSGSSSRIRWTFGSEREVVASGPALDSVGNLHVMVIKGTGSPGQHAGAFLVTIDPNGKERRRTLIVEPQAKPGVNGWRRWVIRSPILDGGGGAWVMLSGEIVRVAANGDVRWRAPLPPPAVPPPEGSTYHRPDGGAAADEDGTLFVVTQSFLLALSADGRWLWKTQRGEVPKPEAPLALSASGAPAIGRGVVYAACTGCAPDQPDDVGLAAFDARTGTVRWFIGGKGIDPRSGAIAVSGDGAVYLPLAFGRKPLTLIAASRDGKERPLASPTFSIGDPIAAPVVAPDDTIVLPNDRFVWRIDPKSGRASRVDLGSQVATVVVTPGALWATIRAPGLDSSRGQLVAVDAAGAVIDGVTEPMIATAADFALGKAMVYAVSTAGRLIAVRSDHAATPTGNWPTPGGDPGNRRRSHPRDASGDL